MRFGITGNTRKEGLWEPIRDLVSYFEENGHPYVLHPCIVKGLAERNLIAAGSSTAETNRADSVDSFLDSSDIILSFGGDGTLLNTVAELSDREIPVLGVNHGRLGFLANVEGAELISRIESLIGGDYLVDKRLVLRAKLDSGKELELPLALNEFSIQRSGDAGLLAIEVRVNDTALNTFWADGLMISTPTGSTAYSLALGGPIMAPGCGSILITPIAPHTLTVRPIVLPDSSTIRVRVLDEKKPHIFSADGLSKRNVLENDTVTIGRAPHQVHLIRFPDQDYFSTLRSKLMWGARKPS